MKIVALTGGVGGSKLLSGLVQAMPPEQLTVIVNTGDDFYWMGLYICPDLDTVTYTLAGLENPQTGWGVADESFRVLDRLKYLGCDPWFRIGDIDLATHIYRTEQMSFGTSLTAITHHICVQTGISSRILPMTDSHVPTLVETNEGTLLFQDYFVRRHCAPAVIGFTYRGIERAKPAPGTIDALEEAAAIIICPSNPFISIEPILSVPGIRETLRRTSARVLGVSPIIGGQAVKGPAARMMEQLGMDASAASVAKLYRDFLDVFVLDPGDESLVPAISDLGIEVETAPILMDSVKAKFELARAVLGMLS